MDLIWKLKQSEINELRAFITASSDNAFVRNRYQKSHETLVSQLKQEEITRSIKKKVSR